MKFALVGKTYSIEKSFLEKVATAAFSCFDDKDGEIELKFATKGEIQELNKFYRAKDSTTDVLSFTLDRNPLIGQIFICYNIAIKQALELGKSFDEEVALLLTHGILHVYGYDHENIEDAKKMEDLETNILKNLEIKRR